MQQKIVVNMPASSWKRKRNNAVTQLVFLVVNFHISNLVDVKRKLKDIYFYRKKLKGVKTIY